MIEFRLLGPLEVVIDGKPVAIAASRQEIVLSLLLLEANHLVSLDRIVHAIWAAKPPRTARNQVHITISALRQLLGEEIILTRTPGYLIRIPETALDLACFERLTASATRAAAEQRIPEAARQLRSALDLWRGRAMEGVQSEVIRAAATSLEEIRISALQDCMDLELQLGRHCEIIGELTKLVSEYPLHERFRAQLMLALYRAGRQADALETFRAGRDFLQQELGLDPGAELRRIERAILTRDPRIDRPGAAYHSGLSRRTGAISVPRQLPRAIAEFTGREEILNEIARIVSGKGQCGSSPEVPVVVLTGRGGTGKTTLAVRAAHLLSGAFPDGQLFLQLHADTRQSTLGLLEHVLLSVGVHREAISGDIDGRMAMFRSWLAGRRVLIVIDGAASKDQITPFLPGTPGCAAIVTSCQRLAGLEGICEIEVGPLDDESAVRLLADLAGNGRIAAEQQAAREMVRLCEGIPLALRIVAAKLAMLPHKRISHMVARLRDEARRLDELDLDGVSVRATLALAYLNLDSGAKRLLRRLSLLGTADFASWVCAPLLGQDLDQAEDLLRKMVESHLVEASVTAEGVIRFHLHDLVRIHALERLTDEEPIADRLDAMRRLLGCWLFVIKAAHRRVYGGEFGVLHSDAERWPLPSESVEALLRKPANWFRAERTSLVAAISEAAQLGLDELCWDLAVTTATLVAAGHYTGNWREWHAIALDAVRRADNRRGEAALLFSLGTLEADAEIATAASYLKLSLKIFDALGDDQGRAHALSWLAHCARLQGNHHESLKYAHQAMAGFRAVGGQAGRTYTTITVALVHAEWLDYEGAEHLLDDALAAALQLGIAKLTAQVLQATAQLRLRRDRIQPAVEALESALCLTRETDDILGQAFTLTALGQARRLLEDLEGAESALTTALQIADRAGNKMLRGRSLLALAELDYATDRDDIALARVDEAIAVFNQHCAEGIWQAKAMELLGRIHERAGRISCAEQAWQAAAGMVGAADSALAAKLTQALAGLRAAE